MRKGTTALQSARLGLAPCHCSHICDLDQTRMKAGPHHRSKHIHMSAMIVTDPMLPESLSFRNDVRRSTTECELRSVLLQSIAEHGLHLSMASQMYMQYPAPSLNSAWNFLLVFAAKDREGEREREVIYNKHITAKTELSLECFANVHGQ